MPLKASYEFLFVGKDDNSFLENYSYDLYQDHGEKSGEIFINLEVQNNPADAEEIGGVIYETMQKFFFENMDNDPYARFEAALKAVNGVLGEFKAQKVSGYIGNLNIVIAAIVGNKLFLTQCGDGEAYLIRKRYVSIITEGLSDEPEVSNDVFSSIASGDLEIGDFVLFSTSRLLRYISKNDLAQCVNRKSITESLAEIQDTISTEILGRLAVVGLLFSQVAEDEVSYMGDDIERATKNVLQSNSNSVSKSKESITGRFVSAFRNYKKSKTQVFDGRGGVFSKLGGFISNFFGSLFSKGLGKDKILAALVVVIVVLAVSIYFVSGSREKKAELERLNKILDGVQTMLSEADAKAAYDKEAAKSLLDKASLDAKSVMDSGFYREKAGLYLLQINDVQDKIDNVKRVETPNVFVDLSTKRPDVNAIGFALVGGKVFVYEYNALYEIILDQVQDPLTIDDKESVVAATGFDDRNSVVFLTKTGKLIEYKDGNMSVMDSEDGSFHTGTKITDWSNRIYVLDSVGNQIWRYAYKGIRSKFGSAEAYISDKTDVSTATDLAIDSNIYVLNNNGDIYKFYAGAKQQFYINNAPVNLMKDPEKIYTNERLDDVYVIDAKSNRILVFAKDPKSGNLDYETQYLFDKIGEIRDLYVDADSKNMYVLTPKKIYQVQL